MDKLNSKIQNAELDGLVASLGDAYKSDKKAQKNKFVNTQMTELDKKHVLMNGAILSDKRPSTLQKLDAARDEKFMNAKKLSDAYAVFPIAEKQALNAPLKALFDKYAKANITTLIYKAESSLIASFKTDVQPYAENIAGLEGMKEALDAFFAAEDAFLAENKLYVQSLDAKMPSASSYRKPILDIINEKLVIYLWAMLLEENEDLSAFATFFANEIARTNAAIVKRTAKAAASSTEAKA